MLKPPPAFTTHDDWFAWLAKHLGGREWAGNALQFYMRQFFLAYITAKARPPLPTFLASKLDALPDKVVDRLYTYVEAFPPFVSQRKRGPVKALFAALAKRTERPLRFEPLRTTDGRKLGALTGVARDQLLLTIGLYVGRPVRSVDTLQRHVGNDVNLTIEHWRILDGDRPAYELWTIFRLTGVVCAAGTATPVLPLHAGRLEGGPRGLATKLADAAAFFQLTNFAA